MRPPADLVDLLRELRTLDPHFRVFGSASHRYLLGPVLSEQDLAAFESANGIQLPAEYREFLATVGNGGAGPFYGLEPLDSFGRDLSRPFPFTESTERVSAEELDAFGDRDDYPGILEFCHQGCAIYAYLIVNGPTYGTIWDGREDFRPTGLTFAAWYRRWLERALRSLRNDPLVARLRVGMSKSEVIAEVGGDWSVRQALHRPIWFFEAPDIPAQLELDEQGVVVKINPWQFF